MNHADRQQSRRQILAVCEKVDDPPDLDQPNFFLLEHNIIRISDETGQWYLFDPSQYCFTFCYRTIQPQTALILAGFQQLKASCSPPRQVLAATVS